MSQPLVLHTFGPMRGVPDLSPFVVKAIVLLKMSGLAFVEQPGSDPRKAPKGKLPVLDDRGTLIADSGFIRRHLERTRGIDFDAGLGPTERATGYALERMFEDHLYWIVLHERWMVDGNFERGPRRFFDAVPRPVRPVVIAMVRRQIRKGLHAHGIGRHTEAERLDLANDGIAAAAALLGDKPYLLGDAPHGADATLFGSMVNLLHCDLQPRITALGAVHANLVAYTDRMKALYFPDFSG